MKRKVLLLTLGMILVLTGCNSDDSEISRPESEVSTTASETAVSQSEMFITETQTDALANESTNKVNGTTITETTPQLETFPEDDTIEEDTENFGELFS